ncbi:MAG TPA: hypothetical protein VKQ32_13790, partial [Polyangia bacterium]|nr:hypothetical protein [Polyangia bacterium]
MSPSPLLIRLAEQPPDAVAVVDADGARTSYGALARRSTAAAFGLSVQGVAGQTVVFLVEPGARYVEIL